MTTPTISPSQDLVANLQANLKTSEADKKLVAWVQEQYRTLKLNRAPIERQWSMNLAFFFGRQYAVPINTAASSTGFRLVTPPAPSWRVRLVINKIRPIIRTELAKLSVQKPAFSVLPRSTEDEDLIAADIGEMILEDHYRDKNVNDVRRSAVWWALLTGTGFVKDYWDQSKTDELNNKGDVCVESAAPYHIYVPDLACEDIEDQPYVMHASTLTQEMALAKYKDQLAGRQITANIDATDNVLDDLFMNLQGAKRSPTGKQCLVIETWIKPNWHPLYPNGGLLTVVGDQIVINAQQYPFSHKEYPFSRIVHIPSGRFYGTSVIEDLIPLQREFNRSRSQIVESKNRMSKPQLLAPKGSIKASRVTSEPGQVIEYTPGLGAPTPLPLQGLPSYVAEELQRLQNDIDDISGQHEISRGGTPPQVTSGTAISYLQEQEDTKLSHTVDSIEAAMTKLGRHILTYVSDYWNIGRLVRTVGMDQAFNAQIYKGADLRGNHDVFVEAGSALPWSKAARQALIMDMIKLGVIPPDQALIALDMKGMAKLTESFLTDQKQAQRENLRMMKLNPKAVELATQMGMQSGIEVHDWDNHQAHIMWHNNFRKSQQFELLTPEQQGLFQVHVMAHQQLLQEQQMIQAQMGMPGQPPVEQGNMSPDSNQTQAQ